MVTKSDMSGAIWDWQLEVRTLPDGTKEFLGTDPSFRVWFEHQLIGGQEFPYPKECFRVTSLKTGPAGYVNFHLSTAEDVALVDAQGDIIRFVLHGHVKLTWEEKGD